MQHNTNAILIWHFTHRSVLFLMMTEEISNCLHNVLLGIWHLTTYKLIFSILNLSREKTWSRPVVCSPGHECVAWGLMTTCSLKTHHSCQQRATGNALASGLPMGPFRENRPRLLVKRTESDSCASHTFYVNHLACIWQLNEAEYTVGFEVNGLTKFNKFPRPNQGKSAEPSFLDISEDSKHLTRGCEKKIDMIQFSFRIINIGKLPSTIHSIHGAI